MKKILFLFSICLALNLVAFSQPLTIEINGSATFNNLQFNVSEAGEDFPSNIESESNLEVSVVYNNFWDKKDNPNGKWRINVHKTDITWNPDINLQIKRTGKGFKSGGNGNPNIQDGENYLPVSNTPTYFFRGKDEIINIPITVQISGISLTMGAKDFETNIMLTVYDD